MAISYHVPCHTIIYEQVGGHARQHRLWSQPMETDKVYTWGSAIHGRIHDRQIALGLNPVP
jgi:hypothetical protein